MEVVRRHCSTVEEYHKMGEVGTFPDDGQGTKLPLCAAAGIPEAWLVDPVENQVEDYSDPTAGG